MTFSVSKFRLFLKRHPFPSRKWRVRISIQNVNFEKKKFDEDFYKLYHHLRKYSWYYCSLCRAFLHWKAIIYTNWLISPTYASVNWAALVQLMDCCLFGAKPLPKLMLISCQLEPHGRISVNFESKYKTFHSWKSTWKCRLRNGGHFAELN